MSCPLTWGKLRCTELQTVKKTSRSEPRSKAHLPYPSFPPSIPSSLLLPSILQSWYWKPGPCIQVVSTVLPLSSEPDSEALLRDGPISKMLAVGPSISCMCMQGLYQLSSEPASCSPPLSHLCTFPTTQPQCWLPRLLCALEGLEERAVTNLTNSEMG